MNLHGFDIRVDHNTDVLRVLLINHRPPFDPVTGEPLDPKVVGANSTIEQFQTTAGSDTMKHVRTYASEVIATPNSVTWVSDHAFVFTNDHGSRKVGLVRSPPPSFPPIHQLTNPTAQTTRSPPRRLQHRLLRPQPLQRRLRGDQPRRRKRHHQRPRRAYLRSPDLHGQDYGLELR